MNTYLYHATTSIVQVLHPAAGKAVAGKQKKRSSAITLNPKASPDSRNIRDAFKKQDSFRRSPAP